MRRHVRQIYFNAARLMCRAVKHRMQVTHNSGTDYTRIVNMRSLFDLKLIQVE